MLFFYIASLKGSYYKDTNGLIKEHSFWKVEILFPLLIFATVFGMRYDVGTDYLNYLFEYKYYDINNSNYELFFSFITHLCRKNGLHYCIYFGILAFIQIFFFFYAFKKERHLYPFLILFLFFTNDWLSWMNIIRQSLAMCIWIYSLKYIEEKKIWLYFLWVFVAFLFHRSAIILFLFYPILVKDIDYFKNIPLQLILILFSILFRMYFENSIMYFEELINFYASLLGKDDFYINAYNIDILKTDFSDVTINIGFFFKLIANIVVILYSKRMKSFYNNKRFIIIYFLFFVGLLSFYIFPAGAISISRPFRYFYIFQGITYAYFIYYLIKSHIDYNKLVALFFILLFAYRFYDSIITAYYSPINHHLLYLFYFQS